MKSILLTFLLFGLLFPAASVAQESYIGIKAGYVNASLEGKNEGMVGLSPRNSFNGAVVFSSRTLQMPLGLTIEPGFVQKGSRIENDTLDYKLNYLSLPVLVDVYPIRILKLSLGLEVGYLASARNHPNDYTSYSILNVYDKRLEVSTALGASVSLLYFMEVGVRYSSAITKVARRDAVLARENLSNKYVQVFVTFKVAN